MKIIIIFFSLFFTLCASQNTNESSYNESKSFIVNNKSGFYAIVILSVIFISIILNYFTLKYGDDKPHNDNCVAVCFSLRFATTFLMLMFLSSLYYLIIHKDMFITHREVISMKTDNFMCYEIRDCVCDNYIGPIGNCYDEAKSLMALNKSQQELCGNGYYCCRGNSNYCSKFVINRLCRVIVTQCANINVTYNYTFHDNIITAFKKYMCNEASKINKCLNDIYAEYNQTTKYMYSWDVGTFYPNNNIYSMTNNEVFVMYIVLVSIFLCNYMIELSEVIRIIKSKRNNNKL